jgi:hypothetical protein
VEAYPLMQFVCRYSFAAFLLTATAAARAQAPSAPEAQSAGSQRWAFSITPYLWAAGIDGDTRAENVGGEIDTGGRFLSFENLDFALAVSAEAQKGRWTTLLDAMRVDFSAAPISGAISVDAELSGGFVETSAAYAAGRVDGLELVVGARYVKLESAVRFTPGLSAEAQESWLDPLIGARFTHAFNDRWSATLRGDIGGFGVSSELVTNVSAVLGFRLSRAATLRVGYRVLQLDFEDDRFVLDAVAQGYAFGVTFAL